MIDSNHDIVPTLRMFDGLMTNIAADEIEALRARVKELEACAAASAQASGRESIEAVQRQRLQERFANRTKTPSTADFDLPAQSDTISCYQCKGCGDNDAAPGHCVRCGGSGIEPTPSPAAASAHPIGEDAAEQSAAPMTEPLRAAVESMVCMLENGEWAEHASTYRAPGDKLAARLEAAITNLHNELSGDSEQADEAVTDGVAHFNWLCSLMPEGFHWGEPLTPDVLDHIASAARAKDSK